MNLNSSLKKTPVAVIGLSAIFADARNIEEYWNNIITGKDSIKEVPKNRWPIEDYYDADMYAPDKTYCKVGGFMPEIDFNPMEFGLPPNILEVTDASQLLGLVAARDAFIDAGYPQDSTKFSAALKEKTGVLLGVGGGQKLITPLIARLQYPIWERALRASGVSETDIPRIVDKMKKAYVGWNENAFPGLLGNVISGRITNRFDLGGINSVVDAACAASLSAIKMALSELVEGRADMMLTGGVDTDNSPFMYMSFSKTPAFSKSGKISPFSDTADGMLIGEGIGMLVLKRLRDAQRDGDRIYSVIKGVGTSSDGRFKSVYAPRPSGQALAMRRAYEDAGYTPATVGLLEAHGTGTGAGDPTEFTSMQMVFGENNPEKQQIALGSVKSQIGHTKAAAGAAGMVKAVLALYHKVLPPTINVVEPNKEFDIKNSAMYINTEARPWLKKNFPRRAGCSAFGFGGINVHITLEEYDADKALEYRLHQPFQTIVLQASSPAALQLECQSIIAQLKGDAAEKTYQNLISEYDTLNIKNENARVGFVTSTIADCISHLEIVIQNVQNDPNAWNHPKGIYYRPNGIDQGEQKVVALFAGQGSQYTGMGKEAVNAFPLMAETFEKADAVFAQHAETPLSNKVFPIPVFSAEERAANLQELTKTQYAQPAIGALSAGQYKVFQKAGFKADFTAGHSFGELTALWAAGVYDEETFLALAATRGAAMASTNPEADSGSMLAVKATLEDIKPVIANLNSVKIANVNSNNQVVLGGGTAAIRQAEEQLKVKGFSVIPLPVSAAFHTEYVRHAQTPFSAFINRQSFSRPEIPVYANSTGQAYSKNLIDVKQLLREQILNPVLFKDQIENMYKAGARIFVEFGPKGVLTNLVKNILDGKDFTALALNPSEKGDADLQIRQAAVQLQVLGLALHNIDPYKRKMPAAAPRTKMNVMLSGNNYVAEPTAKAYEAVMNDGFKISGGQVQVIEKVVEKIVEKIVEVEVVQEADYKNHFISSSVNEEEMMNKEILQLLQTTIESFRANQNKSLEIFERFMHDQNQQAQQLLQLLSQQIAANETGSQPARGSNGNAKSILSNIPAIVEEKPLIERKVSTATSTATSNGGYVPVMAAPVVAAPVVSNGNGAAGNAKLEKALLEVVSEKTGYPAEMLELGMDMEADLGIDSIKRVEIFGALTAKYPQMSGINPNELTELRTLGEIVAFVSGKAGGISTSTSTSTSNGGSVQVVAAPVMSNGNGASGNAQLEKALLEVVSEKTGYPAEVLELGMDMEADLGIDSIKRVEIFGALTAKYPQMSGINPNELTELRTLGEIVAFVGGKAGGISTSTSTSTATSNGGNVPVMAAPVAVAPVLAAPVVSNGNGAVNNAALEKALLEVVSEKTGYPAEMLELGMDMEADLGIDSIKRVEIFGALTSKYPQMSGINPNELTELRTLGEIVAFVGGKAGGISTSTSTATSNGGNVPVMAAPVAVAPVLAAPVVSNGNGAVNNAALEKALLEVVSEKTGYPAEMLELGMDMEADLGIDSIKRVEIFGALTAKYPQMSGINPNELTELRTLGEIVTFVHAHGKKKVLA